MPRFLFTDLTEGRIFSGAHSHPGRAMQHVTCSSNLPNNTWLPPSSLFLLVICLGCRLVQCSGSRELSQTARWGAEQIQEASEVTEATGRV